MAEDNDQDDTDVDEGSVDEGRIHTHHHHHSMKHTADVSADETDNQIVDTDFFLSDTSFSFMDDEMFSTCADENHQIKNDDNEFNWSSE